MPNAWRSRVPLPTALSPRTIPGVLDRAASTWPDAVALVGRADGVPTSISFSEVRSRAAAAAAMLRADGVDPQDRVVWIADNEDSADAVTAHHAALWAGAVAVPLNPRLAGPEIAAVIDRVQPRLVLFAPRYETLVRSAVGASEEDPALRPLNRLRCNRSDRSMGFADAVPVDEDADAVVLFTSGTTGRPKGVVHSHGSALAAGIGWADAFRLQPGADVLQSPFPIFSGAGLHFNGLSTLWTGSTYVVDGTDTATSLSLIAEHRTTVYVAVPSIYQFWLESGSLADADLASLRLLDYGGASMAPAVIERLRAAVPAAGLMQTYGLTEAGPGGLYLAEDYAITRLGSIGNRAAGTTTRFRVVDGDGRDVGPDEEGELVLRGAAVMSRYWRDDSATEDAFTTDGWLRSGDLVRMDADGFVYHRDRLKDIIVRGGYNIASAEVEAAVLTHPEVVEVAVIARPHPRLGDDVEAVVVLARDSGLTAEELVSHCAERLADFKLPRHVRFATALPRNAAGKVVKHRLRSTDGEPTHYVRM